MKNKRVLFFCLKQICASSLFHLFIFFCTGVCGFHGVALAAEADNFTGRHTKIADLPDSLDALDRFVNGKIYDAIVMTNGSGKCSRRELYLNVWNALGRNPISQSEKFAETSPDIKMYLVDFKDGIYGTVPTFVSQKKMPNVADLFFLSGWFSASIRLNGVVIGIDKLGHFFGQGWEYFQTGTLRDALQLGTADELGIDGFVGSGVFSYADLSANYQGHLFWRKLSGTSTPYVSCSDERFVQRRAFSWREYVSASWDEGLNCSKYVSPEMTFAVQSQIQRLGMTCPVAASSCAQMVKQSCSTLLVNPICFSYPGEDFQKKSRECESRMKSEEWANEKDVGLTSFDQFQIKLDKMIGISSMPLHYLARDWRLRNK